MTQQEEWRTVVGWPDYAVSDQGRVKSFKRRAPRILKAVQINGYPRVKLSAGSHQKIISVHILVAEAFVGPRPAGLDVRHLDGDRQNSRADNLVYGTRSENILDAVAHGVHNMARKTHCKWGHPFDADNTYHWRGGRSCRTCARQRQTARAFRAAGIEVAA